MIERVEHPAFPPPAQADAQIWRYLTREKFEWMCNEGRLFMPTAARLGDPLEGTQPVGDANYWQTLHDGATSDEQKKTIDHNRQLISRFAELFRSNYYVSCWHLNNALNESMWKEYANHSESVAIRSDVAKLNSALPNYVNIGVVRYIDYAGERLPSLNMLEYITHKNIHFRNEQELRAVAFQPFAESPEAQDFQAHHFQSDEDPTYRVFAPRIEVHSLIEAVFVHRDASAAFLDHIAAMCAQHSLPVPERAS